MLEGGLAKTSLSAWDSFGLKLGRWKKIGVTCLSDSSLPEGGIFTAHLGSIA